MTKSGMDVMEILEAYDLTRCAHSAAVLVGCDEKTVARYVALRDSGRDVAERERRARAIDPFLAKIEELVDKSNGKIRADVACRRWGLPAPSGPPAGLSSADLAGRLKNRRAPRGAWSRLMVFSGAGVPR